MALLNVDSVNSALTNKRLGITVPRSTLLPHYLAINPYFVEYTNAIDAVFGPMVDEKIDILSNLRNMWVQNPNTEAVVQAGTIIDSSVWSVPEREIVVKQVNMLGMKLQNAGVVTDASYQQMARFVGMYWFGKGTQTFIDFINYCLGSNLTLVNLWTQDYLVFVPEGDPTIGTPVWEGGTWYPTTHVTIEAAGGLQGQDIFTIASFFYEIANYNLVLQAIDQSYQMPILTNTNDSNIVAIGAYCESNIAIANFVGTGAPSPVISTLPSNGIPTTYYAMGGSPVNPATSILMAQPTGWLALSGGQKVPIYGSTAQIPQYRNYLGTAMLGPPVLGQFNLLYGPVNWQPIPGSSSLSRIPTFNIGTYSVMVTDFIPTTVIGESHNYLLVNPTGFFELVPGQFVPYW